MTYYCTKDVAYLRLDTIDPRSSRKLLSRKLVKAYLVKAGW